MTGDAVVLDGDRHESALLEKGGRFQEVCGCGWRSTWTTDPSASREHSEHVAAENLWARLTGAQRAAIDVLVTLPPSEWVRGATTAKSAVRGIMAVSTRVNTRTALWLASRGYVEPEWMGAYRFRLTSRGRAIHPLSRCSASRGGRACGYCHACCRRLPFPQATSCTHCGRSDVDE